MRDQTEVLQRPYISIRSFVPAGSHIFYLRVENTGKATADNLRLQFDRSFYQLGRKDGEDLSKARAFSHPMTSFPPGSEISFILAPTPLVLAAEDDDELTPPEFAITARYSWAGKTVEETTTIDLRMYDRGRVADPYVEGLEKIARAIDKKGV